MKHSRIDIAGHSLELHERDGILDALNEVYVQFGRRGDAFKADGENPHLCRAGCSHCCKSGAVFAVTLVEAVQWSLAVEALPPAVRDMVRQRAEALLDFQRRVFAEVGGPPDVPGERDEALFSARISRVNQSHPACPMLIDDLCSVYDARPMLCRAYGFPVDAYAVESRDTLVFRSLCVLYEGTQLVDYVRAKDLKAQLNELSVRLAGGRDHGRFTSSEAILATVHGGH